MNGETYPNLPPPPPLPPAVAPVPSPAPAPPGLKSFGTLFGEAIREYRRIAPEILPFLLGAYLFNTIIPNVLTVLGKIVGAGATLPFAVLSLASTLVAIVFAVVIPIAIIKILGGARSSFMEQFRQSLKLFVPAGMAVFFAGLAGLGGFALFFIPGIVIGTRLFFSQYAVILEDRRGVSALTRSYGLVKGSTGRVFAYLILLGITMSFTAFFLSLPALVIGFGSIFSRYGIQGLAALGEKGLTEKFGSVGTFISAWSNAVQLLVLPFSASFGFVLFQDLKNLRGEASAEDKAGMLKFLAGLGVVVIFAVIIFAGWLIQLAFRYYLQSGSS